MQDLRENDAWQQKSMAYCSSAVTLCQAAAVVTHTEAGSKKEQQLIAIQVMGIRLLNGVGATDELLLRGYFQPAAMIIRDIVECCFLLDLFSRAPEHLPKWIELGFDAGLNQYKPGQVRDILNGFDAIDREVRGKIYTFYSRQGTHPNPAGIGLIAPNGAVEIAPFADADRLWGLTYDLTRFAVLAATNLAQWIHRAELVKNDDFKNFDKAREEIGEVFFALDAHLKSAQVDALD